MEIFHEYPRWPKQREFHDCAAPFRLYGGANGGGKSYAMRAECVDEALSAPFPVRGLALRKTLPEIKQNMIIPLEDELTNGIYTMHHTDNIMTFANGSTLTFGSAEHEADLSRWKGIPFEFICIEELTDWTEREFRMLMRSLRTTKKGWTPNFFGSTNPGGIGHKWVKRLFIDRQFLENERPEDYAFIPSRVYDNPSIVENDPGYISRLEALPEKLRRAALEGDWNAFEGQYFDEWREDLIVVPPMMPLGVVKRIVAIDYGYDPGMSCVLWGAIDTQGRVWVYRELYVNKLTYEKLAERIAAMTPVGERIDYIVCDPAALEKKAESNAVSLRTEFVKVGNALHVPWLAAVQPAKNERVPGWNLCRRYMQPYLDPNTGRFDTKLKVTRSCANVIRTVPEQIHDKVKVEDMNTHGEDHPSDTLRYLLMEFGMPMLSMSEVSHLNTGDAAVARQLDLMRGRQAAGEIPARSGNSEFWKSSHVDNDGGSNILSKTF